jgi:hypothetical protein
MAKERQEYPDVELGIERDDNGFIINMTYTINNEGEDRKNIIEFIEMLALLCDNKKEANEIASKILQKEGELK